ncbi:O-antigen ligase family protein [Eubacterium sp.]|uniref:O-antigen ligase family protein n=1 Tax=Eubacterium sp. TaxID=142586 RepID=UPI0025E2893F|nr:O-antigen ligase family protein [Eubacterium sp.]MCR5629810.1 O-antigen ligase family protein [Eubacterium sp.]
MNDSYIFSEKYKKNRELIDFFIALAFSGSALFFYSMGLFIVVNILGGIYVLYSLSRPFENSILFIVLALSNTVVFSVAGVSVSLCVSCAFIIKYIFIERKTISANFFILSSLYLFIGFLGYLYFDDIKYGMVMPLKNILMLMYLYMYSRYADNLIEYRDYLYKITVWGSGGLITNVVISVLIQRSMTRIMILSNDSNILAVESAVLISMLLVLNFRFNISQKLVVTVISALLGIILLLTGSRNGLLLAAFIAIFTLICNINKIGKLFWLFVIVALLTLFILYSSIGQNAYNTLLARLNAYNQMGDMSNGRFDIWNEYISELNKSWLNWLLGLGNYQNQNINNMAHNGFLEDVTCNGILGLLLYVILLLKSFGVIKHRLIDFNSKRKSNIYVLMPIFVLLIGTFTLRGIINIINSTLLYVGCLLYYSYFSLTCKSDI